MRIFTFLPAILAGAALFGATRSFDVASVKPSEEGPTLAQQFDPDRRAAISEGLRILRSPNPGSGLKFKSPGYFVTRNADLLWLIARAFGVSDDQVKGPSWMTENWFSTLR